MAVQVMNIEATSRFRRISTQKAEQQICPECNARMTVVDQRRENGVLFTWYECTRDNCNRQWLEKKILNH